MSGPPGLCELDTRVSWHQTLLSSRVRMRIIIELHLAAL
jgi:hypothetical protein